MSCIRSFHNSWCTPHPNEHQSESRKITIILEATLLSQIQIRKMTLEKSFTIIAWMHQKTLSQVHIKEKWNMHKWNQHKKLMHKNQEKIVNGIFWFTQEKDGNWTIDNACRFDLSCWQSGDEAQDEPGDGRAAEQEPAASTRSSEESQRRENILRNRAPRRRCEPQDGCWGSS